MALTVDNADGWQVGDELLLPDMAQTSASGAPAGRSTTGQADLSQRSGGHQTRHVSDHLNASDCRHDASTSSQTRRWTAAGQQAQDSSQDSRR
jgi:hypothetical protein